MDHSSATLSDGVLLRRFTATADEAAFAAIVERHRRLVVGVCRRITGDDHDAEDAAQAVFLVLAVKAGRFGGEACVAAWLHRVARHVALRARASALARRRRHGALTVDPAAPDPVSDGIDEALAGLSEADRAPLLLHYVDGLDSAEIGARLGISAAAAAMRLSRGRARLRRRLGQAGAVLVAGGLAGTASGADAATLSASAARLAAGGAAGDGSAALALARQALGALRAAQTAVAAGWLAATVLVGATAVGGWRAVAADPPAAAEPGATAADPDAANAHLTAARMQAIHAGLARLGVATGSAAQVLQREAHLGGVFEFATDGAMLPTPALAARPDNRFLTPDEIALPHYFGRPWGRSDGIATDDPDRIVTLANLDVWRTFVDERGIRRSSSIALMALSGVLPADDPATAVDDATLAYLTDRDPARAWNDAWGHPLVIAWGLFQPTGAFDERDPAGWSDATRNSAGQRCVDALSQYQYNRCVYIAVASAGAMPFDLRAGHEPAAIDPAAWSDPSLDAWTTTILPQIWSAVARMCRADTWQGGDDPPWRGVRRQTFSVADRILTAQLSAPYELR